MNFVIGSVSPLSSTSPFDLEHYKRPTFNVMEMDPDTLIPVTFKTYSFDIKYANKFNDPKWEINYDFATTYRLPDLSP